jgi:hypothetical protein
MKKIINAIFLLSCIFCLSCENNIDNYSAPDGGVYGALYDKQTLDTIPMPVSGNSGVMIRLYEQNTDATEPVDFYANEDGTFKNSKVFNGDYLIKVVNGPFAGICEDYITIKGQTNAKLYTIPFSRVNLHATVSDDNKISVDYDAVPSNDTYSISNVQFIWNFAPGVDVNNANYAGIKSIGSSEKGTYTYNLMDDAEFVENYYKILSDSNKVYIRMAATVTVDGVSYVNYSKVAEVKVHDLR